jgi:magnesium-transporting ATPase (P-type)
LIIGSSNEESGVVFVDTMALDGETNLKEKVSALEEQIQDLSRLKGSILCELPNDSLEHWEG